MTKQPPPADRALLDFAIDLAVRAGRTALGYFRVRDLAITQKEDRSPVTEADRAVERLVRAEITARFPDDTIVGEEEGVQPGRSGRRWFVDPIDGTRAFLLGVPLFST